MSEEKSLVPGSEPPADPLAWLDAAERYAYKSFMNSMKSGGSTTFPLAQSVSDGLEALFIKGGKTLSEIRRLNPQWQLGQIVHAAVVNDWAFKRQADAALTVARAQVRAKLAVAEGVELAADVVAAIRRLHGDAIAKFLQSGKVSELAESPPMAILKQLKEAADVISKLTGQDQVKKISGKLTLEHSLVIPSSPPPPVPGGDSSVLKAWAKQERDKIEKEINGDTDI